MENPMNQGLVFSNKNLRALCALSGEHKKSLLTAEAAEYAEKTCLMENPMNQGFVFPQ